MLKTEHPPGGLKGVQLLHPLAKHLIAEIAQEIGDTGNPVSVVKGGLKQGTFVAKELVYAMWIHRAGLSA